MATLALRRPWAGITCFFARGCADVDGCVNRLCAVHDVHMKQVKGVRIDDVPSVLEVAAYSEHNDKHPFSYWPLHMGGRTRLKDLAPLQANLYKS